MKNIGKIIMVACTLLLSMQQLVVASSDKSKPAPSLNSLIAKLEKAVKGIERSCKSDSKKPVDGDNSKSKKHQAQVKKARQAYVELYKSVQSSTTEMTKSQEKKIKDAAEHLFECTNIKDMAWGA